MDKKNTFIMPIRVCLSCYSYPLPLCKYLIIIHSLCFSKKKKQCLAKLLPFYILFTYLFMNFKSNLMFNEKDRSKKKSYLD